MASRDRCVGLVLAGEHGRPGEDADESGRRRRGRGRAAGVAAGDPSGSDRRARPSGRVGFDGVDVGVHDLAHEGGLERVDGVLAHDVEAAPGHLLGQDRPLEHQHADQVGDGGGHQQGEQAVLVVGELEGEDDGGER